MKIAINCWVLRNKQLDGIGFFTVNTLGRMIASHPETEFLIMADKNFTESYFDFPNVTIHRVFPPYRHPALYLLYMETVVPMFLKKHKPDLFVSAEGFLSLISSCKQLPVIYDLNFEHFPENLAWKNRVYFRTFFRRFARKAARIATISEYSRNDIVNLYQVPADRIDNVSCGINSSFSPLSLEQKKTARDKFAQGNDYFFFVGSMHPRKNVHRLIKAFEKFKSDTGAQTRLVIAGAMLWSKSEITDTYEQSRFREDIVFTGRLSDSDLALALGGAYALTFVPVFEGFGLPIVEAFQAEVPVLAANVTSLPEVAGEAAVYADPFDIDSIATGMEILYKNENGLISQLIEKGKVQRTKFSWENTAKLMWDCIQKTVSGTSQ